jgi:uncharacterized membrane protein HdeD (DUF308 family)
MNENREADAEAMRSRIVAAIHAHWKLVLFQGVMMVVLGFLAVMLPVVSTLAIELMLGWLFVIGGVLRALVLFRTKRTPGYLWSMLSAVLAVLLGVMLVFQPMQGELTLTFLLTVFFALEGIATIAIAVRLRSHLHNWGWILFNGVVDLVLAILILQGWPSTAAWAIGLLAGINMLFLGLSLITSALAARSLGDSPSAK